MLLVILIFVGLNIIWYLRPASRRPWTSFSRFCLCSWHLRKIAQKTHQWIQPDGSINRSPHRAPAWPHTGPSGKHEKKTNCFITFTLLNPQVLEPWPWFARVNKKPPETLGHHVVSSPEAWPCIPGTGGIPEVICLFVLVLSAEPKMESMATSSSNMWVYESGQWWLVFRWRWKSNLVNWHLTL